MRYLVTAVKHEEGRELKITDRDTRNVLIVPITQSQALHLIEKLASVLR